MGGDSASGEKVQLPGTCSAVNPKWKKKEIQTLPTLGRDRQSKKKISRGQREIASSKGKKSNSSCKTRESRNSRTIPEAKERRKDHTMEALRKKRSGWKNRKGDPRTRCCSLIKGCQENVRRRLETKGRRKRHDSKLQKQTRIMKKRNKECEAINRRTDKPDEEKLTGN